MRVQSNKYYYVARSCFIDTGLFINTKGHVLLRSIWSLHILTCWMLGRFLFFCLCVPVLRRLMSLMKAKKV